MKIKKYRASTLREALLLVKQDLGPQAVVLKTRRVPRGLLGVLKSPEFEVTAAQEASPAPAVRKTATLAAVSTPAQTPYGGVAPLAQPSLSKVYNRQGQAAAFEAPAASRPASPGGWQEEFKALHGKMETILKKMDRQSPAGEPESPETTGLLAARLREQELDREMVEAAIAGLEAIPADGLSTDQERQRDTAAGLAERFPVSGPFDFTGGRRVRAVLAGPTGAGKTTTIAKLAAHYSLVEGKSVGLIAADNYRLAATDQLKTFASIARLPLQIVYNPAEMSRALRRFAECDLVLIDTAGRSPHNRGHLAELKGMLAAVPGAEIHLVISLTTRYKDMETALRQYRDLGATRLLFTKIDETRVWGGGYRLAVECAMPVSYLGTGQAIPEDLQVCTPEFLPQTMLGGILV